MDVEESTSLEAVRRSVWELVLRPRRTGEQGNLVWILPAADKSKGKMRMSGVTGSPSSGAVRCCDMETTPRYGHQNPTLKVKDSARK